MSDREQMLAVKEIAARLGRSRTYVFAMRRRGFRMVAGRATWAQVMTWLEKPENQKPRAGERRGTKRDSGAL